MKMSRIVLSALLALSFITQAQAQVISGPAGGTSGTGGGVSSVTGGNGIVCTPTTITTTGSCATSVPDNAFSANHTVAATDMAGTMTLTGSATLTIPAVSTTIFANKMSSCWSNVGSGTWTISTTPTINGLPSTSIPPGAGGCLVSNGTSLDYQPGISPPSATQLGGVISSTLAAHNFATGISTGGALTGAQVGASDLSATGTADSTHALFGDNTWKTVTGGSGGGGMFNYSENGVTLTANTYFVPAGGGGIPQTTEAAVSVPSPAATTVANLSVSISTTLGGSSTGFTVTLRKGGVDQALTCTFNPSSATVCVDNTHSVNIAAGDIIDWKIVTTGTIVGTPTVGIFAANGTSNVGVTSVAATVPGGFSVSGSPVTTTGTLAITANGTSGGVPYYSGSTTMASSAALAANALVVGGGAGAAPATTTTGTGVLTALGIAANAAGGICTNGGGGCSGSGGGQPSYVSGRYVVPPGFGTIASTGTSSNILTRYQPFLFPTAVTTSQYCAMIRTLSASGKTSYAIYADSGGPTGAPLATTLDISTSAIGAVCQNWTGNVTLTLSANTIYWVAWQVDNATAQFQGPLGASSYLQGLVGAQATGTLLNGNSMSFSLQGSSTFDTFATNPGSLTENANPGVIPAFKVN